MTEQTVRFRDPSGTVVAVARVSEEGDRWGGTIDLALAAPAVRAVFEEFEEIVNGQMFSFLDEIQAKVSGLGLVAEFENGSSIPTADLQVYPSTGDVSFKLTRSHAGRTSSVNR